MNEVIQLNRLNGQFTQSMDHNQKIEENVGIFLQKSFGFEFSDLTTGNNSDYDFQLDGKKIELKIQGPRIGQSFKIGFEVARHNYGNQKLSGILSTTSDYVLSICPGWNSRLGLIVGKMRLFQSDRLKTILSNRLSATAPLHINRSDRDGGRYIIEISPRDLDSIQIRIGDIVVKDYDRHNEKVLAYQLNFLDTNPIFRQQYQGEFR